MVHTWRKQTENESVSCSQYDLTGSGRVVQDTFTVSKLKCLKSYRGRMIKREENLIKVYPSSQEISFATLLLMFPPWCAGSLSGHHRSGYGEGRRPWYRQEHRRRGAGLQQLQVKLVCCWRFTVPSSHLRWALSSFSTTASQYIHSVAAALWLTIRCK